jgi:hypothetical protein
MHHLARVHLRESGHPRTGVHVNVRCQRCCGGQDACACSQCSTQHRTMNHLPAAACPSQYAAPPGTAQPKRSSCHSCVCLCKLCTGAHKELTRTHMQRRIAAVRHVGLPNLLLGRTLMPELLFDQCTADNIVHVALPYLINAQPRDGTLLVFVLLTHA